MHKSTSNEIQVSQIINLLNNVSIKNDIDNQIFSNFATSQDVKIDSNSIVRQTQRILTNNCFPNDYYISIQIFAFIRSFQNFLLFFSFSAIFINYALIFFFVSKRRHKKTQRLKYYSNILQESRSKYNLSGTKFDDEVI